eukprot:1155288-Prorocentrum_minimum.AAC.2
MTACAEPAAQSRTATRSTFRCGSSPCAFERSLDSRSAPHSVPRLYPPGTVLRSVTAPSRGSSVANSPHGSVTLYGTARPLKDWLTDWPVD